MVRLSTMLACAFLAFFAMPAEAADRDEYCRPGATPGRFCVELFEELDPWEALQVQTRNGPVINGNVSDLFYVRSLAARERELSAPVGRISIKYRHRANSDDEWVAWCTGSLVSNDVVLTAYHCLPGQLTSSYVPIAAKIVFNYLSAGSDSEVEWYSLKSDPAGCSEYNIPAGSLCPIAGNADKDLDFVLLRIAPDASGITAGEKFGTLKLSTVPLTQGQLIMVPQHPASHPQAIGFGPAQFDNISDKEFAHYSSTYNMSSGSPVLSMAEGTLLGMHRRGGACGGPFDPAHTTSAGCGNVAIALSAMLEQSSLLQALISQNGESQVAKDPLAPGEGKAQLPPDSFASILARAQSGDPTAQWHAGLLYEYALSPEDLALRGLKNVAGRPKMQNYETARQWYTHAAKAGVVEAATDLAALDFYGIGAPRDETGAVAVFQISAAAGDTFADAWLGNLYLSGSGGLPRDQQKAFEHLLRAAAAGNIYATRDLDLQTLSDGQQRR